MSWIETVPYEPAAGAPKDLYDRVRGTPGGPAAILESQGLRPHAVEAHLGLYRAVMDHPDNRLPRWIHAAIGVYVSMLAGCDLGARQHRAALNALLDDRERADAIHRALEGAQPAEVFSGRELAMVRYARALTVDPGEMRREAIIELRREGFDDGEILELNQVVAYLAYANRIAMGLGVT